ncbi:MAG: type I-MYXAN CRISPR-associated protein Cas6/Cmx6 [Chromatiales bacterium]|jgi:CRISPR-associated protein Cas6
MLWQEETKPSEFQVDDTVIDLLFNIECRELPVDHIHSLSTALKQVLPQLEEDSGIGVHPIHLAGSQNGWERPDASKGQNLILSRRTKMTLRVPGDQAGEIIEQLTDITLDIDGFPLTIRSAKSKKLSTQGTIFSRSIICTATEADDEMLFMQRMQQEFNAMGIRVRKALCGKMDRIATPDGPILTRSLMLAELCPEDSVKLQQQGIGAGRDLGCGIFIPHKGIDAVGKSTDDE